MSKENEFKKGLKYEEDTNESQKKLVEASKQRFLYEEVKTPYTDAEVINADQMVNVAGWNKKREYDKKYSNIRTETQTEDIYHSKRRAKNKPSKVKTVLKTVGALGLGASVALGASKIIENESNKPITLQQVIENKDILQERTGLSDKMLAEVGELSNYVQYASNFDIEEANSTLIRLNYAFSDVLEEKTINAFGKEANTKFGSVFQDGETVQYLSIDGQTYYTDTVLNSLVNENTIPKSMANAIKKYKENQDFMMKSSVTLDDKIKQCEDLDKSLEEFATIQITYNAGRDIFEDHIIRQSELNESLKEKNSNDEKSNFDKTQNAIYPRDNSDEIQNVNYDDDGR